MTTLSESIEEILTSLQGAGIDATADPTRMNFPGVLVLPGAITFPVLDNSVTQMDLVLYLIARGGRPGLDTLDDLQELLTQVRSVLPIEEAQPTSVPLTNYSPDPLPALLVTIPLQIT